MQLCDDWHEEVCYEGRKCPVCKLIEEKDAIIGKCEAKIEQLLSESGDYLVQVERLQVELEELKRS